MAKLDNLLAILWLLRSDERVTAQQISERLEMNIRTVYRYIDTLSMSGVPIIADAGHHGGYTLLNEFIEAPLFFDLDEQAALAHAVTFAKEAGYYGGETLTRALSKLSKHTNEGQESKIKQQVRNLEVIPRLNPHGQLPFLKELEQSISDSQSIKILYYRRQERVSSYRCFDPYKLIYWNRKWYVIGFCHLRKAIRSFRVDRIEAIQQTDHVFEQPEDFSAQAFFMKDEVSEEKRGNEEMTFILRGDKKALGDLCQHWFLEKHLDEWKEEQATFTMEQSLVHQYVPQIILSYGQSIQVLSPSCLKQRLVEVLSEIIEFHQK